MYRQARVDDLAIIAEMEQEILADLAYPYFVLRQLFDLHGPHWVVAEGAGDILGYAVVGIDTDHCAWVMGLVVSDRSRGSGVGRGLLEQVMMRCRTLRVDRMRMTVHPANSAATSIYRKAGFGRIADEERYFGVGEPRHVLEYKLVTDSGNRRVWGGAEPDDPRWRKAPGGPQP